MDVMDSNIIYLIRKKKNKTLKKDTFKFYGPNWLGVIIWIMENEGVKSRDKMMFIIV